MRNYTCQYYKHMDGDIYKSVLSCCDGETKTLGVVLQNMTQGGYYYFDDSRLARRIKTNNGVVYEFQKIANPYEKQYNGYQNDPRVPYEQPIKTYRQNYTSALYDESFERYKHNKE